MSELTARGRGHGPDATRALLYRDASNERSDMAKVVYLHIGAAKTGTSWLQRVLRQNRRRLREDGYLHPADNFQASQDLRGVNFQGYADPRVPGAWDRLVHEVGSWPDAVAISHENFAQADPEHVERAARELGAGELHVVYTARDLARQVPAMWQEGLKNRRRLSFADFVGDVQRSYALDPAERGAFWRSQDAAWVLGKWTRHVPPENIHVVTVPRSGAPSGLLWDRFAGCLGLDPAEYEFPPGRANTSVGAVEAALLRRLNGELHRREVPWNVYQHVVKGFLAHAVLAQRDDPRKISLPPEDHAWFTDRAREIADGLRTGGYDVVGDLEELVPAGAVADVPHADDVTTEEQLDAAVEAMSAMVVRIGEMRESRPKPKARARAARRTRTGRTPSGVAAKRHPRSLKERTVTRAHRHRPGRLLLRLYDRARAARPGTGS